MRILFFYLCFAIFLIGCKTEVDNSANEAFEANSKTVLTNLEGFQNENLDYSMYAKEFSMLETTFGAEKESITLDEMIANDMQMWETFDFKMLTDPPILLPGVNQDTKMPDGSVRHYSAWEVTLPATDSTEAKTGVINLYESFDFDAEGKILTQQVYGDFTGLMMYLSSNN
ncbi:hypothetical protein [uncultured Eudoraea sp.]|jgi:hypothetical protein|uniref:hypothetical protein n=1 Tax=uncultured Eudoraea sp. TaxID=1035614 RepID=UPI002615AAAE|nr:hypothetical protein [uncultured Eudoraea sp.]